MNNPGKRGQELHTLKMLALEPIRKETWSNPVTQEFGCPICVPEYTIGVMEERFGSQEPNSNGVNCCRQPNAGGKALRDMPHRRSNPEGRQMLR